MRHLKKINFDKFHFLLIPVFFIVHNYFDFQTYVDFAKLYSAILGWLVFPFVFYFPLRFIFKDKGKAALLSSLLLLLYFFAGTAIQTIRNLNFIYFIGKYSIAIPLLVILCMTAFIFIKKSSTDFRKLHSYLTITFLVLILVDTFKFFIQGKQNYLQQSGFKTVNTPQLQSSKPDSNRPDIYFLLFDEHPSSNSIRHLTGYDNSGLDTALKKMGFNVSANAKSCFAKTIPALCSLFDMGEYTYDSSSEFNFKNNFSAQKLLASNRLVPFLEKNGYSIINASVFQLNKTAPLQTPKEWWGQPEDMIRNQTIFNRINRDLGWLKAQYFPSFFNNPVQKSIEADVALIDMVKSKIDSCISLHAKEQKFVFAHFFLPHDPYKFDSTGKLSTLNFNQYLNAIKTNQPYIEQIAYTRNFIINSAAVIKKNNKRPAVIIIQGDHGLRVYDQKKYGADEMFNILSAVYFPDGDRNAISDSLFAPNTFRIVLNKYFNQQLPLQNNLQIQLKTTERTFF